eukprot:TRINITY_DN3283_c0_g2_i2.p1 TRINITY_DN3283_c0_g2~~TRINITY_DN3283_c0_g2_i2.p1  ORF type:complete len:300 (+),score=41.49 TRINITY_DN3283_c0_g2_i2:495-1394(+)
MVLVAAAVAIVAVPAFVYYGHRRKKDWETSGPFHSNGGVSPIIADSQEIINSNGQFIGALVQSIEVPSRVLHGLCHARAFIEPIVVIRVGTSVRCISLPPFATAGSEPSLSGVGASSVIPINQTVTLPLPESAYTNINPYQNPQKVEIFIYGRPVAGQGRSRRPHRHGRHSKRQPLLAKGSVDYFSGFPSTVFGVRMADQKGRMVGKITLQLERYAPGGTGPAGYAPGGQQHVELPRGMATGGVNGVGQKMALDGIGGKGATGGGKKKSEVPVVVCFAGDGYGEASIAVPQSAENSMRQ